MPTRRRGSTAYNRTLQIREGISVLALGAHADDIELGCGATLLYLKRKKKANIHYVVFCDHYSKPKKVSRDKEIEKAVELLGCQSCEVFRYIDTEFPAAARDIQRDVEILLRQIAPDLVFAPRLNDNHQDHVVVAEAAFREVRHGQAVWHYEIKQHGQDLFNPNIFIDVGGTTGRATRDAQYARFLKTLGKTEFQNGRMRMRAADDTFAHLKVYILGESMRSQITKAFMHPELLLGVMRVRGMQASPETHYAEAFEGKAFVS